MAHGLQRRKSVSPLKFVGEVLEGRLMLTGDLPCAIAMDDLPAGGAQRATRAVNCFGLDLYQHYRAESGNLLMSPLSITTALAMTHTGATAGEADAIEQVLHLGEEPGIHESFGQLISQLTADMPGDSGNQVKLANGLFPDVGMKDLANQMRPPIEQHYRGEYKEYDYPNEHEAARREINAWVEEKTNDNIEDLIPQLGPNTALVLTNALFLKAFWPVQFEEAMTADGTFHLENGETRTVPLMRMDAGASFWEVDAETGEEKNYGALYGYQEREDFRILEIPYRDEQLSMVILLPKPGSGTGDLDSDTLASVDRWLNSNPERRMDVNLTMPKLDTKVSSDIRNVIVDLGFPETLSGMDLAAVPHKTSLKLNEQGTEAAAATAVVYVVCFAEGTPVLTPDGEKPIEQIQPGDMVLSRDEHDVTAPIEPARVQQTFQNEGQLLQLRVGGQEIRATGTHPFFVRDRGWVPAQDLVVGDMLSVDLGSWLPLEAVEAEPGVHRVYNFSVARNHTYFVGGQDFGYSLWTHNVCGSPDIDFTVDRPFHFMIRDNRTAATLFLGRIDDPTVAENKLKDIEFQQESVAKPGDANGDGQVNFADFLVLSANYGRQQDVAFADGDFDEDGRITFADFLILSENYTPQPG